MGRAAVDPHSRPAAHVRLAPDRSGRELVCVKEQMGDHSIQLTVDTSGHLVPGGNRAAEVLAATETYRREMDVLDRFVTERCTESPGAKVAAGALYATYKAWSDEVGEWRMPKVGFTDGLKARRGLSWHKSNSGAFWMGPALNESDER